MKIATSIFALTTVASASAASCGTCTGCLWTYSTGSTCFSTSTQVECDAWGAANGYTWCSGSTGTTAPVVTTPTPVVSTTKPATSTTAPVATTAAATGTTFFDDFTNTGDLGSAWEVANWANGSPFGCTFAYSEVWEASGLLNININAGTSKCGEARTVQSFTYGKFVVRMQPSTIAGADSSFFLYTGTAGTADHFEIDIEYINGGHTLHTNVWVQGQQDYQQFTSAGGWVTVGFEWRSTYVRWFIVNSDNSETEIRRVYKSFSAPMQLMMNHWNGDNSASALSFLNTYSGAGGAALYDWVKVSA